MTRKHWLELVEEGLRDLLEDLNACGYTTTSSCSGHLDVTGEVTGGLIELAPHRVTTDEDVREVSEIVRGHTSMPFVVRRGLYNRVKFQRPLAPTPTVSDAEAADILEIVEGRKAGGPGRGRQRLSRTYDLPVLRRAAERYRMRKAFEEVKE